MRIDVRVLEHPLKLHGIQRPVDHHASGARFLLVTDVLIVSEPEILFLHAPHLAAGYAQRLYYNTYLFLDHTEGAKMPGLPTSIGSLISPLQGRF